MLRIFTTRSFSSAPTKRALLLGMGGGPPSPKGYPNGLTKEKLMAILQQQNKELQENGIEPTMLLVDHTSDTLSETVVNALVQGQDYDVISIGAGVRTTPEHFLLFENLVNLVHQHAPKARIAFDTGPEDKVVSILRQLSAPK